MKTRPSLSFRRQEHLLAWTIAAGTIWLNVVGQVAEWPMWLAAFFAACIGGWARRYPHAGLGPVAARACLLTAVGLLWPLFARVNDVSSPYFFWVFATTCFYALLLPSLWVIVLMTIAVVASLAVHTQLAGPGADIPAALSLLGLYGLFTLASIQLGRWLRKIDAQVDASLIDSRTRLYNQMGFFNYGQALLQDCRQAGKPFSLVLLNCEELRVSSRIMGKKTAHLLLKQMIHAVRSIAVAPAIASRTDAVEFALVLPHMKADEAMSLLVGRLGSPPTFRLKTAKSEIPIQIELFVAQANPNTESLEQLYELLHEQIEEAKLAPEKAQGQVSSLMSLVDDIRAYPRQIDVLLPN
jgi:GGDEF domain-containing protein